MRWHSHLLAIFAIFFLYLTGSAFVYQGIEEWSYIDSFYFVVMTITTIGYGDIVPITSIGKIFTMFFSFFGIIIAFYLITVIGRGVFDKYLNNRISHIKRLVDEKHEQQKELEKIENKIVNKAAGVKKQKLKSKNKTK